jgi:large subunit ribosomal protein L4
MPQLDVLSPSGQKKTKLSLPKGIFAAKINQPLMAQAVRVYLANQRRASAQTLSRSQVALSKKKIWRQKGTGRARHGSRNAPIFVGGGVAHGPTGEQNYKLKLTQKMKQASLCSALTTQFKAGNIKVVAGLEKLSPQTKLFDKAFRKILKSPRKVILLLTQPVQSIKQGTRNLAYTTILPVSALNTYQTLNAQSLIFTPEAITNLKQHFLESK